MEEVLIIDKQQYLDNNCPFEDTPRLIDKKKCIHCGNIITVGDYKVFKDGAGEEYIYCPNAPACDGTIIDWFPIE